LGAAQVAHDIALARQPETPSEQALSEAWERDAIEDWPAWNEPDSSDPGTTE